MKQIDIIINENEERVVPVVWVDGKEREVALRAELTGNNASLTTVGIFLGTEQQSMKFDTYVTHIGLHTKSLTTIRAVFLDHASFNNDGMVRIQKGAKDANGYFQSKVLLFDHARGRSVPSLEIDENEVKAGHGSTIGRPDVEQVFYLQSRGISQKEAEKVLISGFFEPVIRLLEKKDQDTIRRQLEKCLGEKQ